MWHYQQVLFRFLANGHLSDCHLSDIFWMITVIMRWNQGLCTDLLTFTLQMSQEMFDGCEWGPLPSNDVSRIAQKVMESAGRKKRMDGAGLKKCCCLWSHGQRPKKLYAMKQCHQLLPDFQANSHLPQVSHQSYPLVDKGDTEMTLGAVHKSPAIYLMVEEIPGKP